MDAGVLSIIALVVVAIAVILIDGAVASPRISSTQPNYIPPNGLSDTFPPSYDKTAMDAAAFASFKTALVPSSYTNMYTSMDGARVQVTFDRVANDHEGLLLVLRKSSDPSVVPEIFEAVNLFPSRKDASMLYAPRSKNDVGVRRTQAGRYMLVFKGREYELTTSL